MVAVCRPARRGDFAKSELSCMPTAVWPGAQLNTFAHLVNPVTRTLRSEDGDAVLAEVTVI